MFGTDSYIQGEGCGHEMLFVPFGLHINFGENTGMHSKIYLTIHLQIPSYNICYTVLHCVTLCYTVYLIVGMDLEKRSSVVSAPV